MMYNKQLISSCDNTHKIRPFHCIYYFTGKCWMDALELALRCTSLLMRSMKKDMNANSDATNEDVSESFLSPCFQSDNSNQMNESDCEKHFEGQGELSVLHTIPLPCHHHIIVLYEPITYLYNYLFHENGY